MQQGGTAYLKFVLIVHATHSHRTDGDCTEQLVLSSSCKAPVYRVMLWYNNPYHFLTGWVEAQSTTGQSSQLEKADGGEHPMWLVAGHSWLGAARDSFTGPGVLDAFFDYWLPVYVHEVRYSHRRHLGHTHEEALKMANDAYQEVHSKDGISRPIERIGLAKYHGESTFDDYKLPEVPSPKELEACL